MELYKYMPDKSFEKYIINGPTIRFTPPWDFNDPFEFYPAISGYRDEDKWKAESSNNIQEEFEKGLLHFPKRDRGRVRKIIMAKKKSAVSMVMMSTIHIVQDKKIYDELYKEMGVFCATVDGLNILMWSHYANNHNGVAISFDSDDTFFKKVPLPLGKFRKVLYRKERLILPAEEMINPEQWYIKSDMWEYEHEYRLVSALKVEAKYDWVDMEKGVCRIPKSVIKSVTFGCKCSNKQIDDWRKQLSDNGGFEHLKFYKAEMDKLEYKLNIVPLEG